MAKRFVYGLAMGAAIAASLGMAAAAIAQDSPEAIVVSEGVSDAIDDIFFNEYGPFHENRTIFSYANFFSGLRGFPERRILQDAVAVSEASYFLLKEQTTSDATLRVPDLENPFNTSIQFLPTEPRVSGFSGSEFIFEPTLIR